MARDTAGAIALDCPIPYQEVCLPIWRELGWWSEWLALRASPVYRGTGLPRGNGEPVVLVPGFLGSDSYLREMRGWLHRLGYAPVSSGVGLNADCPDVILERLVETIDTSSRNAPVRLLGHSLGGSLAHAAAVLRPEEVSGVITLGAPLHGFAAHPLVLSVARFFGGVIPQPLERPRRHGDHFHEHTCACELLDALDRPLPGGVEFASIYSRTDGVVSWESSVLPPPAQNVEVRSTHLGLAFNPTVYQAIARLLSARPGDGRRPLPGKGRLAA